MPVPDYPLIPYGWADFRAMRLENRLYVDKTHFLHPLEDERFVFLIRPRRFGKSCWLSLLENYYDRKWASEFEQVFGGTNIGREPTENRHSFVTLRFDFSVVPDAPETLEREFEDYCGEVIRRSMARHPDLFPQQEVQRILAVRSAPNKLTALFGYASTRDIRLFVLVDDYDSFANTKLAHHGAYGSFYHGFFAALKSGAGHPRGLERVFITGATPLALEDAVSGFNIGKHISLEPEFNALLGFTEAEVRGLVRTYRKAGVLSLDDEEVLDAMRERYGGYRFAKRAKETVYNTNLVLYFLDAAMLNKRMPDSMLDENVRMDYSQLRHLHTESQSGAIRAMQGGAPSPHVDASAAWPPKGHFGLLQRVVNEGQVDAEIRDDFTLERLERGENFLSLLYYVGLLSIREEVVGWSRLHIPNLTARRLLYFLLRDVYDNDAPCSDFPLAHLLHGMACDGEWKPVFDLLCVRIAEQAKNRGDLNSDGIILSFLEAELSVSLRFQVTIKPTFGGEVNEIFADILLEPRYPELRHGYLIEIKYLNVTERASEAQVRALIEEAEQQLRRYLADERLARAYPSAQFIGLTVVFHGWRMVRCQATAP